jgi:hypothetical protein
MKLNKILGLIIVKLLLVLNKNAKEFKNKNYNCNSTE